MSVVADAVIGTVAKVIDRVLPDKEAADRAKLELLKMQMDHELELLRVDTARDTGQMAVNQAEASNPSVFVSGWRPFIGWVGGLALAYQFIGRPLLEWGATVRGWPVPPALDLQDLMALVMGMLGIGGMRTLEKVKGVARM